MPMFFTSAVVEEDALRGYAEALHLISAGEEVEHTGDADKASLFLVLPLFEKLGEPR